MRRVAIVGAGYVGVRLGRRLVARGLDVRGSTTTPARLDALRAAGLTPVLAGPDAPAGFDALLSDVDGVVHLAPPDAAGPEAEVARLGAGLRNGAPRVVYGSTTGAFGRQPPGAWVDERTAAGPLGARGARRTAVEDALHGAGLDLVVVRIVGIYGPGRTLAGRLAAGGFMLFEGGPFTSRIHVDDLAALLEACLFAAEPPRLVVACDDHPAPTLEVARFVAEQRGLPMPPVRSLDEAKRALSPTAAEMRLSGRRCRSLFRADLMGSLRYPSYREGLVASWAEEVARDPAEGLHRL